MPVAIPFMIGTMIAGTAISAYGQKKAGDDAKAVGELNAKIAEQQAEDAITRGREDENRFRQGVRTLIGSQRAGFAGQNVDVGIGSAVDVQADTAFLGELDALMLRENAAREASGYRQQAGVYRKGGQAASTASKYAMAGTILGGATAVGGSLANRYGWGA